MGVSVYPSQTAAITAMEMTINTCASVIKKDLFKSNKDLWWSSDGIPDMVFTIKWNTIIEVGYYNQNFESTKYLLFDTAYEISKRVDRLSK